MSEVMEANKALITISEASAFTTYTTYDSEASDNTIEPILKMVRDKIDAFEAPSVATRKGREEIKAFAFKITKSRTYLEKIGAELAAKQKAIPKKIDACRRHVEEVLSGWEDEVRKPLTDWEKAEDARIKKHTDAIAAIAVNSSPMEGATLVVLRALLRAVEDVIVSPECEEFEDEYRRAKESGISKLTALIAAREQYERDQAELAELRAEREAREATEREERAARDAKEAQERQERETQARIAAEAEKLAQAERDRAAQALRESEERSAQALAEAQRRERAAQAQAEAAEQAARDTEARVKREADAVAQREADELAKREADKSHKAKINREAVKAFVAGGMSEEVAKLAVTLIAKKAVPAISIQY